MTRLLLAFVFGCAAAQSLHAQARSSRPSASSDGWLTAPAESLGVDPARLAALTSSVRAWPELGVHAIDDALQSREL